MKKILAVCVIITTLAVCSFASTRTPSNLVTPSNLATPSDLVIVDKT